MSTFRAWPQLPVAATTLARRELSATTGASTLALILGEALVAMLEVKANNAASVDLEDSHLVLDILPSSWISRKNNNLA